MRLENELLFGTISDVEYGSVSIENQGRAKELEHRLGQLSAQAHASMAGVALAAAEFDELGGWCDGGIRSFEHWLSIAMGFDPHTGKELLRVGQALQDLPLIAAAFAAGQLSFDKVRQVTTVAGPETDELMLEIARGASASQLARICRSLRRMKEAEAPHHDREQLAGRGLWTHLDDDGMMRLVAKLPAEDGAVVVAAIESITGSRPVPDSSGEAVPDPADDRWAARRADALVAMSEHVLSGVAGGLVVAGEARQVVVHVDVGVLTGETPDGVCHLENGAPLSAAAARRIGCDAEILPVIERDGLPIDVGRKSRSAPQRLRRALEVRDRFCRFPGCNVPAHQTHAHHLEHWALGGPTALDNMILLCGFHHRSYHDGGYQIVKVADGCRFETDDGHLIGQGIYAPADLQTKFHPETARAEWGGEHMDFDHTMFVLEQHFPPVDARAGPPN
ncbi:MAG: DUF222 domain-containing protein [Chloroflexi bacterium]|nr:MAG: DUF222 domain-containing protein [Chloroflexota bacterium]